VNVTIKPGACIGSGQCAAVAGEVFDTSEDGYVVLIDAQPAERCRAAVEAAARICPVDAIVIS
jgi:ferredoxin